MHKTRCPRRTQQQKKPELAQATAFAIAMPAAGNWTPQEIAEHLNISANTVETHILEAIRKLKLNVENRKDINKFMLL